MTGRQRQTAFTCSEAGVSLIEILVALVVLGIVSGMAIATMVNLIPSVHADSSLEMVVSTLQQAHQAAMTQRRNFVVTFKGTNEILVQRLELDSTLTPISDNFLGNDVTYTLITGVPDTPDTLGKSLAVNFPSSTVTFLSDGTAVNNSGQMVDGTVFMAIAGNAATARAVTVMGATSRIKGYRYTGSVWN